MTSPYLDRPLLPLDVVLPRLLENIEAQLQKNLEAWSKAQIESVQQQAGGFSADLLARMRAESETISQHVHERLKSEAEALETSLLETMQSRLQTVNEELRSVIARAFA